MTYMPQFYAAHTELNYLAQEPHPHHRICTYGSHTHMLFNNTVFFAFLD